MLLQHSNNLAEVRIKSTPASPKLAKHLKSMQWKFFWCLCGSFVPCAIWCGSFWAARCVCCYLWQWVYI